MVCPSHLLVFSRSLQFLKHKTTFSVFPVAVGRREEDRAVLLKSHFYLRNAREQQRMYPSLFQSKQRIIFLIVPALKMSAFIF